MACILVVDDDELVRLALREALEGAGHQVVEAEDGKQGVDCYKAMQIDLVVTNIVMPEMDGLEEIRRLEEIAPDVKIIVVTGYDPDGEKGYLALAESYGAARTFTKPFDVDEMKAAVAELLAA